MNEYEVSLKEHEKHSIKYIIAENIKQVDLDLLLRNLSSFKGLIDKSLQHINKKRHANIPVYFNTVFSGSFGIQLSTPSEVKLFDSDFDKAFSFSFETIYEILNADLNTINEIVARRFNGNKRLINKYTKFFREIAENKKAIKIEWTSPRNIVRGFDIKYEVADNISKILKEHEKYEVEELEIKGMIKGISLIKYEIEFKENEKRKIIKAKFEKNMAEKLITLINKDIIGKFKVNTELNEVTEEEVKKYEMIEIVEE